MLSVENKILTLTKKHKSGIPLGITSICSANESVIKAAMIDSKKLNKILLVESTSNQVDQFGGYTGMTPEKFKAFVFRIADSVKFPKSKLYLGGDHLGPNVWTSEPADSAMEKATDLVKAYVRAGYSKIHIDVTMKCADDGEPESPLDAHIIAERTSILCKAAEDEVKNINEEFELPVYVIGSDVPPPGGTKEKNGSIRVTESSEVEDTIFLTKNAFLRLGLEDTWERVIAVVVQPGVEFGDEKIYDYDRRNASQLIKKIESQNNLVYEAHSTDFQLVDSLRQMVEDHFAILKVGPWLTYAFREAVFALEKIEKELFAAGKNFNLSNLTDVLELSMKENPKYWKNYYRGNTEEEIKFKRKFSLSDRIRYYWNEVKVRDSLQKLVQNLSKVEVPLTLVSQFFPESFESVRHGEITSIPERLITNRILTVLAKYNFATMGGVK